MKIVLNTISKKFLLPTLTLSVVLLFVLGMFMAKNNSGSIRTMMDSKGDAVADFIMKFSSEYFAIFDFSDFENFVKALETDEGVEFAAFYNARMDPLSDTSGIPEDTSSLLVYERQIKDEAGNLLGYLKLGYNQKTLSESMRDSIMIIVVSTLVALLLLALGITLLVRRVITKRVQETVEMLKDIAQGEGDLTKRLDSRSKDEMGELSRWFNTFIDNLQGIISKVQTSVDNVSSSSNDLSATADDLSKGTNEQALQSEQVATAMTEMSQTIIDVAKNAGDASEAAGENSEIASKGKETSSYAIQAIQSSAAVVNDASEIIENLGNRSKEIGEIVSVITEIADQTNLLALNAAIEAARAGEQGRGFAVVADEVRKLAERTGKATEEIRDKIQLIQMESEKSVETMRRSKEEVDKGVELINAVNQTYDAIVSASTKSADMVQRIAAASEEQSTAAEQVSQSMENITNIARESSDASARIKEASAGLAALSSELKEMTAWFKV